jgi:hypothetical protein
VVGTSKAYYICQNANFICYFSRKNIVLEARLIISQYEDVFNRIYQTTLGEKNIFNIRFKSMLGGSPCHHGMTRPRVADGRDGHQLEVSCEYIEQAAADKRQGVVLQFGGWAWG